MSNRPKIASFQNALLGCLTLLASTSELFAEGLEDLEGLWKSGSGNIFEIEIADGGQAEAKIKELSDLGRQRGFSIGENALRNIQFNGATYSFEIAFRQLAEPHTLVWIDCNDARIDRGTLVGSAIPGEFNNQTNEFSPFSNPVEYALVPRCPIQLEGTLTVGEMEGVDLAVSLLFPLRRDSEEESDNAPESAVPEYEEREGYCLFEDDGVASISIQTGGIPGGSGGFRISPTLNRCDIGLYWKEYTDARRENGIAETSLSWGDNGTNSLKIAALSKWGIDFKVYSFGATFVRNEDESLNMKDAFIDMQIMADGPAQALGPFYISGDMASIISYAWNDRGEGVTSWTDGQWYFDSLAGVQLELRRGGHTPIASMNLEFRGGATMVRSELTLHAEQSWNSNGYEITISDCTVEAIVSLEDGSIDILGGGIVGKLDAGNPIEGKFDFAIEWRDEMFRMSIASTSKIKAFGGDLTNIRLAVDLDPSTLVFTKIEGSVAYKHSDFEVAIQSFLVENGELKRFLGSGNIEYKQFAMNVRRLSYDGEAQPSVLELSAALSLGWSSGGAASAEIEGFTVNTQGVVSSFSVKADLNASPVEVGFEAAFNGNQFSGRFRGKFAGNASFGGSILIGRAEDYNYGELSIQFNIRGGVPIGQSGLKLLGLNGAFGCNYNPPGSPLGPPFGSQRGTYYIQAGLTVGDVAGLASLNGTVSLYLGRSQAVSIAGTLQVTQSTPYFRGTLTCNYVLGSGALSGSLTSTVKIPISGSVVSIDNNTLNYRVGNGSWSIQGRSLGGDFFSFLNLRNGHINLQNRLDRPISSMTGSLGGSLSGRASARWAYPSDFRCSSERYDFGVAANFSAEVSGTLNTNLNPNGSSGSFNIHVALSGRGSLRLRSGWFGFDCTSVGVSANGNLRASNTRGNMEVAGNMTFSDSSGWISKNLYFSHVF